MRLMRNMSTSTLAICGIALKTVITIWYSPFHDFISRSIRAMRSMRRMRRKESLTPLPAKMMVSTISTANAMHNGRGDQR